MKLIINIQQEIITGVSFYKSVLTKIVSRLQNFEVYEFARMIKVKKENGEWLMVNTDNMRECMDILEDGELNNINIVNLFEAIIKKRLTDINKESQYFLKLLN